MTDAGSQARIVAASRRGFDRPLSGDVIILLRNHLDVEVNSEKFDIPACFQNLILILDPNRNLLLNFYPERNIQQTAVKIAQLLTSAT